MNQLSLDDKNTDIIVNLIKEESLRSKASLILITHDKRVRSILNFSQTLKLVIKTINIFFISYSPEQKLSSFQTLILDENPNSDYFRITEFKDTFTGGKNGFLIEGSQYLKESTGYASCSR